MIIAFDLETSGLNAKKNEIVQIAGAKFELGKAPQDTFCSLVKPLGPIPRDASVLHGITKAKVKNAPSIASALQSFSEWAGKFDYLVAHNAPFDSEFLVEAFHSFDAKLPPWKIIDLYALAYAANLSISNYKLPTLGRHFKAPKGKAHDAESDSKTVAHVFNSLYDTAGKPPRFCHEWAMGLVESALARDAPKPWESEPASEKQLSYLESLGASAAQTRGLSKGEASKLIDKLRGN